MIRSGDRIATGTGRDRRRLTLEEAEAGGLPEPMTRHEWDAMYQTSRYAHNRAVAAGLVAAPPSVLGALPALPTRHRKATP